MKVVQSIHGDIAIIGVSCNFPDGNDTPDKLWHLLSQQKDVINKLHPSRWQWPEHLDLSANYKGINHGGFFENIDCFDASFFKISPKEAKLMDPQQWTRVNNH